MVYGFFFRGEYFVFLEFGKDMVIIGVVESCFNIVGNDNIYLFYDVFDIFIYVI